MSGPGPPLSAEEAEARRRQLVALTDPTTLLLLSRLAQAPHHTARPADLSGGLAASPADVQQRLAHAEEVGLVRRSAGSGVTLTAEAWQRYRRIIAPRLDHRQEPVGVPRLEPAVDWVRYPVVVHRVAQQLARRFRTTFSRQTVERYVADSYDELATRSQVHKHLPMLTNRLTTDRLGALAAARGLRLRPVPVVLFVCVHNSGRSQLATVILRHLAGELVSVSSAGTVPATAVDPVVAQAVAECGIEADFDPPQQLSRDMVVAADVVVTMGCGEACPVVPGRRYFDWSLDDPAGQDLERVRLIRDEVWRRVEGLLDDLGIGPPDAPRPEGA